MEAKDICDITISIDCDGQDDINVMNVMVKAFIDGSEVVYGVRSDRSTDSWFKRTTAQGFYKFLNMMEVEVVYNHADYRLVSAKVLKRFEEFSEVNIFLRGMFPLVGFKSTSVYYKRHERASLICIVCFLGGIQLVSLGVIGEYVGKTYMETKRRPRYIISSRTIDQTAEDSEKR